MENIGDKIKKLRKSSGLSLRELAKRLNLSDTALSKIETGKTKSITIDLGISIAKAFDISFNELFSIVLENSESDLSQIENLKHQIEVLNEKVTEKEKIIDLQEKVLQTYVKAIFEAYYSASSFNMVKAIKILENTGNEEAIADIFSSFAQDFLNTLKEWGAITDKEIQKYYKDKVNLSLSNSIKIVKDSQKP